MLSTPRCKGLFSVYQAKYGALIQARREAGMIPRKFANEDEATQALPAQERKRP